MATDRQLPATRFGHATLFESGYLHGFRQTEVDRIHFEVVPRQGLKPYPAAIFVQRGRRKEERIGADRVVVLEGWGFPAIETDVVDTTPGATVRTAKFPVFSEAWDRLLNDYLAKLHPPQTSSLTAAS